VVSWLGSTPQKNPWTDDWISFFRDHRLGFQLQLIKDTYRDNDLYAKGEMAKLYIVPLFLTL
jgi:protein-ribulosamine 3-kinase